MKFAETIQVFSLSHHYSFILTDIKLSRGPPEEFIKAPHQAAQLH